MTTLSDFQRFKKQIPINLNVTTPSFPPLFNQFEVFTSCARKAERFVRKFSFNSTLDSSRLSLPNFPLSRNESLLNEMNITASMVSSIISNLGPYRACRADGMPVIVLKTCAPERIINAALPFAFLPVGNPHLWFQFFRSQVNSRVLPNIGLLAYYLILGNFQRP